MLLYLDVVEHLLALLAFSYLFVTCSVLFDVTLRVSMQLAKLCLFSPSSPDVFEAHGRRDVEGSNSYAILRVKQEELFFLGE